MARILVIDDDTKITEGLKRILEGDGHEVCTAPNGQDALRWFAGDPTDLVITDIYMPELDGIELIMRLRETFPEVPVIAMSGGSGLSAETVLSAAGVLGAARTLAKPITAEGLRACVAEILGESAG